MPACIADYDDNCPHCKKQNEQRQNEQATPTTVNASSSVSCNIPDWWYDGYNQETETPIEPVPLTPEEEEFQNKMKAEEAEKDKQEKKAYELFEKKQEKKALEYKKMCRQQVQRAAIRAEALIACLLGVHFNFSSSKAFVDALKSRHKVLTLMKKLFGLCIKSKVIDLVNQDTTVKVEINELYDNVLLFDKEYALHLIHETDDYPVLRFVSPFMSPPR